MKCFKRALCLLLLTAISLANSAVYEIVPTEMGQEEKEIVTGDFVTVKIASSDGEIPDLVGKRIGGVLYVMKQVDNRLDVIVAPPAGEQDELIVDGDKFVLKGLSYKHEQTNRIKNYITEDFDYDLEGNAQAMTTALLLFVFFALMVSLKLFRAKRKKALEKKKEKEKLYDVLNWMKSVDSREGLEEVPQKFLIVKESLEYSQNKWDHYLTALNAIQFKRKWSEEEMLTVKTTYQEFLKNLKVKSGI